MKKLRNSKGITLIALIITVIVMIILEREELRKEYIKQFRAGMTDILDNTYIKEPDGTLKKLQKK